MIEYRDQSDGCWLPVWVQPRSSKNQVVGEYQGALKIRLAAPPVDGAANQELCSFLAQSLKIGKNQVDLQQGQSGRHKIVRITGLNGQEVLDRLNLK
ncbi:MAG: DUF167 domain-containing protein [Methylocystaceae bacterium]